MAARDPATGPAVAAVSSVEAVVAVMTARRLRSMAPMSSIIAVAGKHARVGCVSPACATEPPDRPGNHN